MSTYLLDALCAYNAFPGMSWAWTPLDPSMHIHCKLLSYCNHRGVMEKLTGQFLIPLYKMIFEEEPPCMSLGAMEAISEIVDWFTSLDGTLIRVFDRQNSLHLLPRYTTNKIFMQEVSYHLAIGLSAALHMKKKAPWPNLPMQIGLYEIKNMKVMDTEGKVIDKFTFNSQDFNLYDPCGIYKDHCAIIHFQWLIGTFQWQEEDPWKNFYNASKTHKLASFVGTS